MNTKLFYCGCKNDYQDKRYGPGRRVCNSLKEAKGGSIQEYRCTVCERIHS